MFTSRVTPRLRRSCLPFQAARAHLQMRAESSNSSMRRGEMHRETCLWAHCLDVTDTFTLALFLYATLATRYYSNVSQRLPVSRPCLPEQ